MTDFEARTFIPSLDADVLQLIKDKNINLDCYSFSFEVTEKDFGISLKNALANGRFEITGERQGEIPPELERLVQSEKGNEPEKKVILRDNGVDRIVKAGLALIMIQDVIDRQKLEHFSFVEIVNILSKISGGDKNHIREAAQEAFSAGKLVMLQDGLPVNHNTYNYPAGSWNEYSTPEKINKWLADSGAEYRFPSYKKMPKERHIPKQSQQEEAIIDWLTNNGYNPQALPLAPKGHSGVKNKASNYLLEYRPDLFTNSTFPKAWQRLRNEGRIKDES